MFLWLFLLYNISLLTASGLFPGFWSCKQRCCDYNCIYLFLYYVRESPLGIPLREVGTVYSLICMCRCTPGSANSAHANFSNFSSSEVGWVSCAMSRQLSPADPHCPGAQLHRLRPLVSSSGRHLFGWCLLLILLITVLLWRYRNSLFTPNTNSLADFIFYTF